MADLRRWKLIAFLFAIPVIAGAVFQLKHESARSEWMDAVRKDFPSASAMQLQGRSLDAVCTDANFHSLPLCLEDDRFTALRTLAVTTAAATVALLLLIWWAGQRSRRDRRALLNLFKPGTYAVLGLTLGIVIVHTILFIEVLIYVRIFAQLAVLAALGALIAVLRIVHLIFTFQKEIPLEVDGDRLDDRRSPELTRLIGAVAQSVGTRAPDNIIAGTGPTFFVTETPILAGKTELRGRSLCLSVPLCRILTENELKSILGHELAHFHGQDTEFSCRFFPAYRRGLSTLQAVAVTAQSVGGGGWALLPAAWLLSFYLESFSAAEAEISRQREITADAIGARISGARDLGVALMKVIRYEEVWEQVYKDLLNGEADKECVMLPGELFQRLAEKRILDVKHDYELRKLQNERLEHPTDSHPPLQERLAALGLRAADLYEASSDIRPVRPAVVVIPDSETLERELLPTFTPKHAEVQAVFNHQQPGFTAMEYYALILNRSFLVYAAPDGLYGIKFMGLVTDTKQPRFFEEAEKLLDNPWFVPGSKGFEQSMKSSQANFVIAYSEIIDVAFDSRLKWGMGAIEHSGQLKLRLRNGKKRTFVLLGSAYGDGIRRVYATRLKTLRDSLSSTRRGFRRIARPGAALRQAIGTGE
jgi:Zn-dependent protease with chaperone function